MKESKSIKTFISVALIVLIWGIVAEMGVVSSYILPSPNKVIESFVKMVKSGEIFEDIYISNDKGYFS